MGTRAWSSLEQVRRLAERARRRLGRARPRRPRTVADLRRRTGAARGLYLRAIDLAKVGYLVLEQGQWNGRQVVSSDWLARSTAPITPQASRFGGVSVDYGLLWWIAPIDPARSGADVSNRVIIAAGNMNQFLFVVPSLDLVVVSTGATNDSFGVTVDFVVRELIPAIRGLAHLLQTILTR